jgi:hypothetical protein
MSKPSSIDNFKDDITNSYESGVLIDGILQSLVRQGFHGNKRTLERRINAWGLRRMGPSVKGNDEVVSRIRFLFEQGWKDTDICTDLRGSGTAISARTVQHIRLGHGLKRRIRMPGQARDQSLGK